MNRFLPRALLAALVLAVVSAPAPAQISTLVEELNAVEDYNARVNDYVTLHRLLEGPLPPQQMSRDLRELRANVAILARQIMTARKGAEQGDIITPRVARVFRLRVAKSLKPATWRAVLAEHQDESPARIPPLRANAPWPEEAPFNFVPPQLLQALPPLPPELQYRIIDHALVLWDHHANIVVDFLPGAFVLTT